jgi:hypothetical protein
MDIEQRLTQLESRYRRALSASNAAKANYFCLAAEPGATLADIDRAKSAWEKLEAHKREIAARMGEIEDAVA